MIFYYQLCNLYTKDSCTPFTSWYSVGRMQPGQQTRRGAAAISSFINRGPAITDRRTMISCPRRRSVRKCTTDDVGKMALSPDTCVASFGRHCAALDHLFIARRRDTICPCNMRFIGPSESAVAPLPAASPSVICFLSSGNCLLFSFFSPNDPEKIRYCGIRKLGTVKYILYGPPPEEANFVLSRSLCRTDADLAFTAVYCTLNTFQTMLKRTYIDDPSSWPRP